MKKRWLLIVLLVSAVLTSMVEGSSAIYTWSQAFNFNMTFAEKPPEFPIHPDDFLKYEMLKIFDQSKVELNVDTSEIDIRGEAGAYRCMSNDLIPENSPNWQVHARISNLNPAELKNFGITFLSSHADNTGADDTYLAVGYVLKFDQVGDLYIESQKIFHTTGEDSYDEEFEGQKESYLLLKAADVKKKLGNLNFNRSFYFDIYSHKKGLWEDESYVSVYINHVLINEKPQVVKKNYLKDQTDVEGNNVMIGVSSYQTRDASGNLITDPIRHVFVNEMYVKSWDNVLPPSK